MNQSNNFTPRSSKNFRIFEFEIISAVLVGKVLQFEKYYKRNRQITCLGEVYKIEKFEKFIDIFVRQPNWIKKMKMKKMKMTGQ